MIGSEFRDIVVVISASYTGRVRVGLRYKHLVSVLWRDDPGQYSLLGLLSPGPK